MSKKEFTKQIRVWALLNKVPLSSLDVDAEYKSMKRIERACKITK